MSMQEKGLFILFVMTTFYFSLTDMAYWESQWHGAIVYICNYYSAFPALTSQNICIEKCVISAYY